MAGRKKSSPTRRKVKPISAVCIFCKENRDPSYKEYEELQNFLSDRGKILSRARSGVCAKHQRRLTKAIKRARHLALLPFSAGITE